jgi:hypothetical protein
VSEIEIGLPFMVPDRVYINFKRFAKGELKLLNRNKILDAQNIGCTDRHTFR